jgi:hypothetical protein
VKVTIMKTQTKLYSLLVLSTALLALSTQAHAQGGGSGGGGNGGGGNGGGGSSVSTGTLLTFDSLATFGGTTPTCSGDYSITNPIPGYYTWTTFKVNCKVRSLNLPDNSVVNVTLFTKDAVTGVAQPPVSLGSVAILNKSCTLKSSYAFLDMALIYGGTVTLRGMDKVVLTTSNGDVIAVGH